MPLSPWLAKTVILAASVALVAIRVPHGQRSRSVKIVASRKGTLETVLLTFMWIGFFLPLIWIVTPVFPFAEYPLRVGPLLAGVACFVVGLWLFYRSHADLGTNWSISLDLREGHQLVTGGVYRRIRHPMYTALLLYCIAQALVIPNWIVGPIYLVLLTILLACRLRAEEAMMREQFGDQYTVYMAKTKRLVPGVW